MTDFTLPTLGDLSTPQGQQQVKSYLYQLTDQLRFALTHIDRENISGELMRQYENAVTVSQSLARLDQAVQSAQGKTQQVAGSLESSREELLAAYEDLKTAMLAQADEITMRYENAISISESTLKTEFSQQYALKTETASLWQEMTSRFEQTAQEIMAIFSESYEGSGEGLENFSDQFRSYIRFSMDGVELGRDTSSIVAKLQNDRLAFVQKSAGGEYEVAYISNKKLYITEANVTASLTLGDEAHGFLYDVKADPQYGLTLTRRGC